MDRHYQGKAFEDEEYKGTEMKKVLIIESSDHPPTQLYVDIPYNSQTRELDLGRVLHNFFTGSIPSPITLPHGQRYQIFYYSGDSGYFVFGGMYPFEELLLLDEQYVPATQIFIKINRIEPIQPPQQLEENKKKRVNDRFIKEVLEKVAEWRKIQQQGSITLEQAAKIVNVPKKTLDDYFYQIKQGQEYGFDFEANLHQKIGVLRKYVREHHKKNKPKNQVKILEEFMGLDEDESDQEHNESQEEQ